MEGRIYRYTLSPKAAAIFPLPPARVGGGVAHTIPGPTPSATRPAAGTLCPAAGYWVCSAIHRVCSDMHQKQAICRKQSQLLNKILILLVNFGRVKRGRTLKYQRFCGDCILCSIIRSPVVQLDGVIYAIRRRRRAHQTPPQMPRICSR